MKKKVLLSLLILGTLTGCGKIPKLANGEEAVVSFKKEETAISATDLYNNIKKKYALSSLIDMIDSKILLEKYADKASDAEKEADSQIENIKKYYVNEQGKYDEEQLLTAIKQIYGIDSLKVEKYYKDEVAGDISAKHILITPKTTDDMSDEDKKKAEDEALKTAKEVINKLNKGEDFDKLAKEYSNDDSNKDNGGDLGYFNKGAMVEEFEKAAYALKLNTYTKEPVKTKFGYHIILKTGEKEKASLDSQKDTIREKLAKEKREADAAYAIEAMVEIRKSYGMKIQDDELAKQYETYISNQLLQARSNNNN